jgi:hypothetical protein
MRHLRKKELRCEVTELLHPLCRLAAIRMFIHRALATLLSLTVAVSCAPVAPEVPVHFVFTADPHYGLTRAFRGDPAATSVGANQALVQAIHALPGTALPAIDGDTSAPATLSEIAFVAVGGDIATRQARTDTSIVQPATTSWQQFSADYLTGVTVSPVYVVPGNHDASNAVGHHSALSPPTDPAAMVGMFNLMVKPNTPRTAETYVYANDRVNFLREAGGVQLMFLHVWPDTAARAWMTRELARLDRNTPVFLFAHDPPAVDARHFRNPNGSGDINAQDRFENLLSDVFASGTTIEEPASQELAAFEDFLVAHPNVVAYFHGHRNYNEFYDWTGPSGRINLPTFRADSPMRGVESGTDQSRLSFHVATIDRGRGTLTVREYFWNAASQQPDGPSWGASRTVPLSPRTVR